MSHNGLVSLEEAARTLGVTPAALYGKGNSKYKPYKVKIPNQKAQLFDINRYKNIKDLEEILMSRVTLFIEYLVEDEDITYTYISQKTGVSVQTVANHDFSVEKGLKIARWFSYYRPFMVKRFDESYGWKHKTKPRPITFKGCDSEV